MARLFEQGGDVEPQLTHKVAWGLSGVSTKNSTWQTIVNWLQGTLSFLKPSNNLSDVADAPTALSNIGGIGASALTPYALKTNVLELNNTVAFTPDNDYEPCTKKYTDDQIDAQILLAGKVSDLTAGFTYTKYKGALTMTASRLANGVYRVNHNLNSLNYYVLSQCLPRDGVTDILLTTADYNELYFEVRTMKDGASYDGVFIFEMKSTLP